MLKKSITFARLSLTGALVNILIFIALAAVPLNAFARFTPADGSVLNYRIIGFSFPVKEKISQYILEICKGNHRSTTDFERHLGQTVKTEKNKIIVEVPSFGADYTWRVTYRNGNSLVSKSELFHFSTGTLPKSDSILSRLNILVDGENAPEAYILTDESDIMYDRHGCPVWYLPGFQSKELEAKADLKVAQNGSITFMVGTNAYEVSYGGKVLWCARNSNINSLPIGLNCHHELTKLKSGHFFSLVSGLEEGKGSPGDIVDKRRFFPATTGSTLAEFDENGTVVWSWNCSQYLLHSDLQLLRESFPNVVLTPHENAVYFSEKDSVIYLSLSGISRILKIKYPSGKVLGEYGQIFKSRPSALPDTSAQAALKVQRLIRNSPFCRQHALQHTDYGFLYVYNNNFFSMYDDRAAPAMPGHTSVAPQIVKFEESGDTLREVWAYDCTTIIGNRRMEYGGGGNVLPMAKNALFVSMSAPYGDMFVVDADKKILWHAVTEVYDAPKNKWVERSKYRASIISRSQLESLIWNE